MKFAPEVEKALNNKKPIVALESTIISHGLPRPTNLEVAREVEEIVRANGATPATIALLDGIAHIGLSVCHILVKLYLRLNYIHEYQIYLNLLS